MAEVNSHWTDSYKYIGRNLKMQWEKYGGKICTIAGTTGLFLTGAHACRKTYKIHDELAENGRHISDAKKAMHDSGFLKRSAYIAKETIKYSAKSAKHYLPDFISGALSGYAVSKGWNIEHRHYKQAAAVVGVLAADFMAYRNNVIADLGVEADRKYLTTKRVKQNISSEGSDANAKSEANEDAMSEFVVSVDPNMLKILYSKETTPMVWSESPLIRESHLNRIQNTLAIKLIYGGHYTANDVRREFYGVKGDIPECGLIGRVWDPGNPEHPERGAMVNLHYQDDIDFMEGRKDWTWIIIDIDNEPLLETLKLQKNDSNKFMKSLPEV